MRRSLLFFLTKLIVQNLVVQNWLATGNAATAVAIVDGMTTSSLLLAGALLPCPPYQCTYTLDLKCGCGVDSTIVGFIVHSTKRFCAYLSTGPAFDDG